MPKDIPGPQSHDNLILQNSGLLNDLHFFCENRFTRNSCAKGKFHGRFPGPSRSFKQLGSRGGSLNFKSRHQTVGKTVFLTSNRFSNGLPVGSDERTAVGGSMVHGPPSKHLSACVLLSYVGYPPTRWPQGVRESKSLNSSHLPHTRPTVCWML